MKDNGFSLVELSIVLVILGLLVGGVLSGQSLIHAAELRSISKEYSDITSSTRIFRDKYFLLPGDFAQAASIWGEFNNGSGPCPNPSGNPQSTKGVCNGNGDGQINACTTLGGCTGYYETSQFWLHLVKAGLLANGTVDGHNGGGQSLPARYGKNTYWSTEYYPHAGSDIWPSASPAPGPQHILVLGKGWGNSLPSNTAAIRPEDAWNVDTKMDDGKPATGGVQTSNTAPQPNCYASTDYLVSYQGDTCSLIFYNVF